MTERRLTIRDLTITDGTLPPATVSFGPGLNLIIGASDTGKTFVFEAIDFMLGAKDGLRPIPEADGYGNVSLTIDPSDGAPLTLQRAFQGGSFGAREYGNGRGEPETATLSLGPAHRPGANRSLSAYLLHLVGIDNRQVRQNVQGEKKALSFRHVAHLTLISEERIIQQSSPVLSEHDTEHTAEANVFAYFLTGHDDSAIIAQEGAKSRKARLAAEADLLESILEERKNELARLHPDPDELANQAVRLEAAIEDAASVVVASQEDIAALERSRGQLFEELTKRQSRLLFLQEQLKRLRLLNDYYRTDRARLEAVIEASHMYHDLPEGECPLCKQAYPPDLNVPSHSAFEAACEKEVEKIDSLRLNLAGTIADFDQEEGEIEGRLRMLAGELSEVDRRLQRTLLPMSVTAKTDLQRLMQTRTAVAHGVTLRAAIHALQERLEVVHQAQNERVPKPGFEPRATTSSASGFCKVVEELLRAWKYPAVGPIAFDTDKLDLVIGGKDRANTGKGYRAITYAAFAIGLMKYCRQQAIPHPGFVVLDTPLNPYKGPTPTEPGEKLADTVKAAFYEYLMNDQSGDQVIVMENEDPPEAAQARGTYYHFTRNAAIGRYGFFPPRPTQTASEESLGPAKPSTGGPP